MNKILYALAIVATLVSCAESYSIQGSSSVSALDGSKLYLKTVNNQELKNLDSCDVVHGKFRFAGLLDTVKLANLYMDDESLMMPVVVEKGEIEIRQFHRIQQSCKAELSVYDVTGVQILQLLIRHRLQIKFTAVERRHRG